MFMDMFGHNSILTLKKYLFRNVFKICLRNIFSNIFDWYYKYFLSKCCKKDILQGNKIEEVCKGKTHSKNVCTLLYIEILRSARNYVRQNIGLCQAMSGHFSKKSCYWSKTLTMVLNVKTVT